MYRSPIEIIEGKIKLEMDDSIMRAVQSYGVNVDKQELLRALAYDRRQYDKGYSDAMQSIVKCKECCFTVKGNRNNICVCWGREIEPNGYCYLGERMIDNAGD